MMGIDPQIKNTCAPINRHDNFNFGSRYGFRHGGSPISSAFVSSFTRVLWCNETHKRALCSNGKCGSSTAPKATGKPRRTAVDASFALDELIEWLGGGFVLQRIPQNAGPFRPRSFVDLGSVGGAEDQGGERLVVV